MAQSSGGIAIGLKAGKRHSVLGNPPLIGLKEARDRHLAARQKLAADVDPMA